jgi:hypothetical protein
LCTAACFYVYNTSILATECGPISPGAAVCVDGIAYWMGFDNFFMYDGAVDLIFNVEDIRKAVFDVEAHRLLSVPRRLRAEVQPHRFPLHDVGQLQPDAARALSHQRSVLGARDGRRHALLGHHFQQGDTRDRLRRRRLRLSARQGQRRGWRAPLPWSLTLAP